jgi:uncharacterized protein YfdQ (DUF2303 family)
MNNKLLLFLFTTLLLSCQSNSRYEGSDLLIKWAKEFVTEDDGSIDEEYGSLQNFVDQHLNIEYTNDTIYAQAMQYVNACGDAIGRIRFQGDTLILDTKETKNELCSSADWYKFEYWIYNPDNKEFVVVQ